MKHTAVAIAPTVVQPPNPYPAAVSVDASRHPVAAADLRYMPVLPARGGDLCPYRSTPGGTPTAGMPNSLLFPLARSARVHVMPGRQRTGIGARCGFGAGAADAAPEPLDSAILFAPVGELVLPATEALDAGARWRSRAFISLMYRR